MSFEETLREKIKRRRETVASLDAKIDALTETRNEASRDVGTLEEVLKEYLATLPKAPNSPITSERVLPTSPQLEMTADGQYTRGLSSEWKTIMKRLGKEPTFNYDDVVSAAAKSDKILDKGAARTRIFGYLKSGYVERIQEGVFRLTQKGRNAAE